MSSVLPNFILVDDSRLDCFISEKIIKNTGQSNSIRSFIEAKEALTFVKNTPPRPDQGTTIILLDIQMPVMSGFDFADAFEKLSDEHKRSYMLFMISSSTNETERMRISNYPSIRSLYKKPLNKEVIQEIVAKVIAG